MIDQCPPSPIGSLSTISPGRRRSRIVEQEADAIERDATITRPVYEALAEAELFWTLVPDGVRWRGLGIVQALEVIEEISRADASTGWALMANSFSTGIAAGST